MKRLLVCGCLVLALVLPAAAGAASHTKVRSFSGTVGGGGTVNFDATVKTTKKKHHKKKVKVTSLLAVPSGAGIFQIEQVPTTCDQGQFIYSFAWLKNQPVKKNQFNVSLDTGGIHNVFKGKFMKKGKKASGTFRASGAGDPSHSNCDTGTVHWSAD
jgi:hypothetical protein